MDPSQVLKPYVTEEMAKEIAGRLYGLEVISIKQLVSFDDRNFHIMVSHVHTNPYLEAIWKHGYTLKFTNVGKSAIKGHFDSMHNVMMHLKKKGMRLPFPVRNLEGNTWTLEEMPVLGGKVEDTSEKLKRDVCGVHMLTYIPGVPVGSVRHNKDILYQWGRLLAEFHNSLQDYKCPIFETKSIYWNLSHVPEVKNFMEGLDLGEQNISVVSEVLENYPQRIYSRDSAARKGLLHGDFNENNILVQIVQENGADKEYVVDGILDLEDMHCGPYVWDVGVMLAYVMLNCEDLDPIEGFLHTISGYLSLRSLNAEELSLLKICAASRLSQSAVLTTYSYKLDPDNSYILCGQENKWSCLHLLWKTPDELLREKLEDISRMYKNLNNLTENPNHVM